ncbi:MAG: S-methyl-5'-thioadenosine phosphorylase [Candidatus Methanomethylophilaceae archaeon]|nr:S-methyl-5'-thioadenosine phosphorylase [Candidatus Methanomethylophilaceae archaeon]
MPRIGIIGGTGVYNQDTFELKETVFPDTPYGKPSDKILIGKINGVEVAFLPRHGMAHQYPPTDVPYKANIYALKQLGVEMIVSPCAVGSLTDDFKPGDLIIVDQFIDFTKCRDYTFFHDRTVHMSIADPFCPNMNRIFEEKAKEMGISYHMGGRYVCIEGPRFSTRAESHMFRSFGDLIGMTVVPECQLAREMGMCYCSLATITDYDAWKDEVVDFDMIVRTMNACLAKICEILERGLPELVKLPKHCVCIEPAISAGAVEEK